MLKAVILDYGVGNIYSLKCALGKIGFTPSTGFNKKLLNQADVVILPGVGNFLKVSGKLASIKEHLTDLAKEGTPILGICLGMQLLFQKSEEGPGEGLALLGGENVRLPSLVKVPHMGWNIVQAVKPSTLFDGIGDYFYGYFAHSYYPVPAEKDVVCAETTYGVSFASVVAKRNIFGTQFHPEKSGSQGLKFLKNFRNFVKR
ncbi:MAG: imidazole glycerol phosphate synthase subunit HisH [Candidatus Bathyarchaeia archaeon]